MAGSPDLPRAVTHALEYSNQVSNIFVRIYLRIYAVSTQGRVCAGPCSDRDGSLMCDVVTWEWDEVTPPTITLTIHRFHNQFSQSRRRPLNSTLNVKALEGAFSVIVKTDYEADGSFAALIVIDILHVAAGPPEGRPRARRGVLRAGGEQHRQDGEDYVCVMSFCVLFVLLCDVV